MTKQCQCDAARDCTNPACREYWLDETKYPPCPECDGEGYVYTTTYSSDYTDAEGQTKEYECPTCWGNRTV